MPNTASLNTGSGASVNSISCSSAGNCSAGGTDVDGSGANQAFVVDEANGTWGQAEEVPNTSSLNTGGGASVQSISCSSAGNCSAGGRYSDGSGSQAFVVDAVQVTPPTTTPPTTTPPTTTPPTTTPGNTAPRNTVQLAATGLESGDLLWVAMAGLLLGAVGVAVGSKHIRKTAKEAA